MIFQTTTPIKEVIPLTGEQAMIIYGYFKAGKTETQMFIEDGISFDNSKKVKDEIERISNDINTKMSGRLLLSPEERSIDEDTDESIVIKEAVYFKVTTKTSLKNSLTSDLLNANTVLDDYILWSKGTPEVSVSWIQFVNGYNEV